VIRAGFVLINARVSSLLIGIPKINVETLLKGDSLAIFTSSGALVISLGVGLSGVSNFFQGLRINTVRGWYCRLAMM
jgi:uncharacterized protein (UPF0261 family)